MRGGPNDIAQVDAARLAGFWPGLWHGVIYPITFFVSLFNKNVTIYEVHNNGGWYNFGFVFGIALLHAIVDAPRRARRRAPRKGADA